MSVKINIKDTDMYTALQAAYLGTLILAVSISAEHMDRIAAIVNLVSILSEYNHLPCTSPAQKADAPPSW
jgi:hypothetical protein